MAPDADEAGGEPVARRAGPRVIELDDRLNDPVKQIEFKGIPLVNFLKFVSDYSTIPIYARCGHFALGTSFTDDTCHSPKPRIRNVADVLQQGLAPLELAYRVEGDQLFITRRSKTESGIRTVTFKVLTT